MPAVEFFLSHGIQRMGLKEKLWRGFLQDAMSDAAMSAF
jgi:hypothetical protein